MKRFRSSFLKSVFWGVMVCGLASWLRAEYLPWQDSKGRTLEAEVIRKFEDAVLLRTKQGQVHQIPLDLLSDASRKQVASVEEASHALAKNMSSGDAAKILDQVVGLSLKNQGLKRSEKANDAQFVRRVYLDVTGSIPSYEATLDFIKDRNPNKKTELIKKLMGSKGYTSHWFNYFADLLRVKNDLDGLMRGEAYALWLKDQIAENVPYNMVVKKLLTSDGKIWNEPASGYLLRDSGMPLDNLANTVSVFLGTEIACAQCHDHPFDDWTQKEFYQMAAFFGGTVTQLGYKDLGGVDHRKRIEGEITTLLEKKGIKTEGYNNQLRLMISANRYEVKDLPDKTLALPHDYQYENGKPGDVVSPSFLEWSGVDNLSNTVEGEGALREQFANWLTDENNPRFAVSIANRIWKRLMGVAVVEPVDNLGGLEESEQLELALFLQDEMKRVNFDLQRFMQTILLSETYQAGASRVPYEAGEYYGFVGPAVRRMSAEQIWDSFMTLVLGNPDDYQAKSPNLYGRIIDMDIEKTTALSALNKLSAYDKALKARRQERATSMKATLQEGNMMSGGAKSHEGFTLMRASELEQPSSEAHFLRQFGQSDRSLVDNASLQGSVPQVLTMLNGKAQEILTHKNSLIHQHMNKQRTPDEKVETVFLSILNRYPSFREKEIAEREINKNGEKAYADIIWALINTREFLFTQ